MAMETNELIDVHELTPFKKFIMSIGAIPTSYLESMSYAELLMWFCNYLQNTVIPTVNNNGEAVEELQGLFVELHNYVENYFDNLDVQNEINNKLDEMAEDGSLTTLISAYVQPLINEQNQNINNFENRINSEIAIIGNKVDVATSITPLVVSNVSAMTNTNRIYVNSTDGKWYYYDGDSWEIGGTYQASAIANEGITNKLIKRKNVMLNDLYNFNGYNLKDKYDTDNVPYNTNGRLIHGSDNNYTYEINPAQTNFYAIKTRIPQKSYITINKELSNRFRVCLYTNQPQNGDTPDKVICDDASLTTICFDTESYNWMIVFYTSIGEEIDIDCIVEHSVDYKSYLRENNIDIFDAIHTDNLFDDSMIVNGAYLGGSSTHYNYYWANNNRDRCLILPLMCNETYTLTKTDSDRFRVVLFADYPVIFDNTPATFFASHPQKVIIDDDTANTCTFDSEDYRYCVCLFTVTGLDATFTITNTSNIKYKLKKQYINEFLTTTNGGYILKDSANASNVIWTNWDGRLAFGMNTATAPVPVWIKSQLLTDGTIIARNSGTQDYNRWGYHIFEGYGTNNYDRITMLLNKHDNEIDKKVAELYYYTGNSHAASSYAWFRLGSDVQKHSFMFDRDSFVAYGVSDLRNVMTLARISPTNDLITTYETVADADAAYEPETYPDSNAKCLLYIALKNAQNGSMFYDTDRDKIVVKVNDVWCDMNVTPVPDNTYDF